MRPMTIPQPNNFVQQTRQNMESDIAKQILKLMNEKVKNYQKQKDEYPLETLLNLKWSELKLNEKDSLESVKDNFKEMIRFHRDRHDLFDRLQTLTRQNLGILTKMHLFEDASDIFSKEFLNRFDLIKIVDGGKGVQDVYYPLGFMWLYLLFDFFSESFFNKNKEISSKNVMQAVFLILCVAIGFKQYLTLSKQNFNLPSKDPLNTLVNVFITQHRYGGSNSESAMIKSFEELKRFEFKIQDDRGISEAMRKDQAIIRKQILVDLCSFLAGREAKEDDYVKLLSLEKDIKIEEADLKQLASMVTRFFITLDLVEERNRRLKEFLAYLNKSINIDHTKIFVENFVVSAASAISGLELAKIYEGIKNHEESHNITQTAIQLFDKQRLTFLPSERLDFESKRSASTEKEQELQESDDLIRGRQQQVRASSPLSIVSSKNVRLPGIGGTESSNYSSDSSGSSSSSGLTQRSHILTHK